MSNQNIELTKMCKTLRYIIGIILADIVGIDVMYDHTMYSRKFLIQSVCFDVEYT